MEKLTLGTIGANLRADAADITAVQLVDGNAVKNTGIIAWVSFKGFVLLLNLAVTLLTFAFNWLVKWRPFNYVAINKVVDLASTEVALKVGDDIAEFTALSWEYSKQLVTRSKHESAKEWYDRIMSSNVLTAKQKSVVRASGTKTFNKSGEKEDLHRAASLEFYLKKWNIAFTRDV